MKTDKVLNWVVSTSGSLPFSLLLSVFENVDEKMFFRRVCFPKICPKSTKGVRGKRVLTCHSQKGQRDEEIDAPVHARS